jgi:peptidyl-prolyl cis-trans isomerase C
MNSMLPRVLEWGPPSIVMKPSLLVFLCLSGVWAQTPAAPTLPELPDETVVATFDDGGTFTMGEFKKIYSFMPPEQQRLVLQDRKAFLQQWALMRKLALMAEAAKLDQQSPTKDAIRYNRTQIMSQAELDHVLQSIEVEPAEIVKYYDINKDKYRQVHVRAIYIAFGGKKLSEEDARAKAAKIVGQARGGADFIKLVKENSDDETSRAKDGDFATLRPGDNIPDAVRAAVFSLKQKGDVSDPVRQPNGFYLFRADEVVQTPLSQIRDQIFTEIKQKHFADWLEQSNKDAKVTFSNPAFIGSAPAQPAK